MPVKIRKIPGELPKTFWERETIFVSNLQALFFGNEKQTDVLRREISGVPTYGGRVVPVFDLVYQGGKNILFLESKPDPAILEYLSSKLHLTIPEIRVFSFDDYLVAGSSHCDDTHGLLEGIRETPAEWMDAYVTDEVLAEIARKTGKKTICSHIGSKDGNNKFLLHNYLVEKKLPTFDTCMANSPTEVLACCADLQKQGYDRAVLKSQIGASGCGLIQVQCNDIKISDVPEYLFHEGPCLVQGWIEVRQRDIRRISSPSVQIFINDEFAYLYDLTEQLLSKLSVHEGNISPPSNLPIWDEIYDDVFQQAGVAAKWLYKQGYRGTASVDFLVLERDEDIEVVICEINARFTGATYPSVLARHFLPRGAWLMRNLKLINPHSGASILKMLDKKGLLYKKGMERGVLPVNFNLNEQGEVIKGQFLFLAYERDVCESLLEQIHVALPLIDEYERD